MPCLLYGEGWDRRKILSNIGQFIQSNPLLSNLKFSGCMVNKCVEKSLTDSKNTCVY